ncbi:glycosyltransferase family 2 protein [Methylomonas rosea]|uniref:Glycosyltransferase family 2 protein n=1 Tax=Methylomonas rosea TaxID=2952227 RepID=A0ABT1TUI4_9GAMM|nr:glycosyltransferase family 2 protein [Methylomonas sp. WSC-7]MCQ8118185.1 glycosyltransferase family 2 protein [Methylomonas sp. WSC-7]
MHLEPPRESSKTCAIIIPIYNEEGCLEKTISQIKQIVARIGDYKFEIICVNDGSSDSTPDILDLQDDITILTHEVNRGYGAALRTGLDYCHQEWIFICDADDSYELGDLEKLLEATKPDIQMIVGAREGIGISSNPFKRLARWILRKMVHGLTGVMVPDLNSGLRLFRRSLYLEFRHLLPMGFSFTTTITVSSLYSGYHIRFIPTKYHKRHGKSSIRPVRDFMLFCILIIRLASYFEPLNFFLPASFFVLCLAIFRSVRDIIVSDHIGSLSVIMFILAFQTFVIGVLADVIVRRSKTGRDTSQH